MGPGMLRWRKGRRGERVREREREKRERVKKRFVFIGVRKREEGEGGERRENKETKISLSNLHKLEFFISDFTFS